MTYPTVARQGVRDIIEFDNRPWRWKQWLAADASAMCVRPDGTVMVLCGDTFTTEVPVGTAILGSNFTSSSLLLWKDGAFGVRYRNGGGINVFGAPNSYFPNPTIDPPAVVSGSPTTQGFRWGRSGWFEPNDNRMHLMVTEYAGSIFTAYIPWGLREYTLDDDFTFLASSPVPGLTPREVGGAGQWVTWGQSYVIDRQSGWAYIFGSWARVGDNFRMVVCRRQANLGSLPGNLPTFWNGSGWSADMNDVATIAPGKIGNAVGVIRHPGGGYLATAVREPFVSNKIGAWHADNPQGPWTDLGDIFAVNTAEFPGLYCYGGTSFIAQNGMLRVMYNVHSTDPAVIRADYRRYGVRWAEVPVPARSDRPGVLREASLWLDARYSVPGEQLAVNQGSASSVLNAQYGSTAGADTNDPRLLPHTGENYIRLPGLIGNHCAIANSSAFDISGDIEIEVWAAIDTWVTGALHTLVSKHGANGARSWQFNLNASGFPTLNISTDGTVSVSRAATAVVPAANGERIGLKVSYDADDGAGNRVYNFFTTTDPPSHPSPTWTPLGATQTIAGPLPIFVSTTAINIGRVVSGSGQWAVGNFHRVVVRNGIGGPVVLDVNAATDIVSSAATAFIATSGQSVTVARAATGRKTALVTRPTWLFGTDDFLEIADNALLDVGAGEPFTALAIVREFNTPVPGDVVLSKQNGTISDGGYRIRNVDGNTYATDLGVAAGANVALDAPDDTTGALHLMGFVRDAGTLRAYVNNAFTSVADPTWAGSLANAFPFRVGGSSTGSFFSGEIVAVAVWRRALSAHEIATINTYYNTA